MLPPVLCSDITCPEILKTMTAQGKLGVKSGEGFYEYRDELKARRDRDTRIMRMLQAIRRVETQMKGQEQDKTP